MDSLAGWLFFTRWGNSVLLLPVAACLGAGLWLTGERGIAWRWATCFGTSVLLVLATKVAFLGWGVGIAYLDFTGISGHSMLAAAVLPTFAWWATQERPPAAQRRAVIATWLLALVVGVSRVALSTHSVAEVVAGLALGTLVTLVVVPRDTIATNRTALRWVVLAALLTAGMLPGAGTSDEAHGVVVRLALALSGRQVPYDRSVFDQRAHAQRRGAMTAS